MSGEALEGWEGASAEEGGGLGGSKGEQTGNWEVNHRTGDVEGGRVATSTR